MTASTRLDEYRTTLRQRVLPGYDRLGSLTLVYLLGSLVSGYADDADLDIMLVWDEPDVPAAAQREPLVARFDEQERSQPFVVDYHDIHLERFVIAAQEYNLAHLPLAAWQTMIQAILDGQLDRSERVLDPLVATAGFYYGVLVLDRQGVGQQIKARLRSFPAAVKQECRRAVLARRQAYLADLQTLAAREDWFKFHCILVEAVRLTVRALFSLHEVYYPGDKWLRQAIVRFGLEAEVLAPFDRLWAAQGTVAENAVEQIAALRRLMDRMEEHKPG
jgi:hypothetical protein